MFNCVVVVFVNIGTMLVIQDSRILDLQTITIAVTMILTMLFVVVLILFCIVIVVRIRIITSIASLVG